MKERIKTAALVATVTVLIWVWAEAESLSTQTLSPRLELVGSQNLLVKGATPGWTGSVTVRLRGATASLDRAQRVLSQAVRLSAGAGGVPTTPGEHVIDVREALRADPEFRRAGVTIEEVTPATLTVVVQTIEERSMPIRLKVTGPGGQAVELEGEPTLSVSSAVVRASSEVMRQMGEGAAVVGVVEAEQVGRLRDDQPQTVTARLVLPEGVAGGSGAVVTPERVSVVLRLRSRVEAWELASVPVWIAIPPTEGGQWEIELAEPFLTGVKFRGPKEAIASLRERGDVPVAYLNLTSDDLERAAGSERGAGSKRVVFSSLPGVIQVEMPRATVEYRVKRRNPGTSPDVP